MDKAEKRRRRRELRLLQDESTWLQKALFALRKAETAREKRADVRDEEPGDYALEVGGRALRIEALEDALDEHAAALRKRVREGRRAL